MIIKDKLFNQKNIPASWVPACTLLVPSLHQNHLLSVFCYVNKNIYIYFPKNPQWWLVLRYPCTPFSLWIIRILEYSKYMSMPLSKHPNKFLLLSNKYYWINSWNVICFIIETIISILNMERTMTKKNEYKKHTC